MSEPKTRRVSIPDLIAIQRIADILEPLSDEQVSRVLVYVLSAHAPAGFSFTAEDGQVAGRTALPTPPANGDAA